MVGRAEREIHRRVSLEISRMTLFSHRHALRASRVHDFVTTAVVRDTPSDRHFPAWSRPKPAPERYLGKHFVHRVTNCTESDLDWLPSAQNVTLCTKCSALHKTFPYTPSPARPGVLDPGQGEGHTTPLRWPPPCQPGPRAGRGSLCLALVHATRSPSSTARRQPPSSSTRHQSGRPQANHG